METPNGAKRQEAHRTPRGKRASWSGNQLLSEQQCTQKQLLFQNIPGGTKNERTSKTYI
ncbi:hypothetical protein QUF49_12585 [Fictibacillus sp. b24]|uniref:hypothetical protein n=1 Tax=Fictibacillus sp. b24 TaxID=3055863 RepID=UPI0025A236C6|nr:hypothetical protein [Fictibacillus sp. b24]MDM5316835.1 hypothetical protein [Fictibacillus sp. b24]